MNNEKGLSLSSDFAGVGTSNFSLGLTKALDLLCIPKLNDRKTSDGRRVRIGPAWHSVSIKTGNFWIEYVPFQPVVMLDSISVLHPHAYL
jgi:hypothetical protein